MSEFVISFLVRPGCHLCDEAKPVVEAEVGRLGGRLVEVNIESDDNLVKEYGLRIPVVIDGNGTVLAEGLIQKRQLRRSLRHRF